MKLGIRLRLALWLFAALIPVGLAASYIFNELEEDLLERVSRDLESVRDLEQSRIENALELYRARGRNLADGPHVRDFVGGVVDARQAGVQSSKIGGYDGFLEVNAFEDLPLQALATALQRKATATEIAALQLRAANGALLGETRGYDWEPVDEMLFERAMETRRVLIGDAFRDSDGIDRLGLAVPILSMDNTVVGVLALETELGPIVDLVSAHEGFGETSEAHIAQMTVDGDAEFITVLRFERDAAFTKVVPSERRLPINQSLDAVDGALVMASDYRGEPSILAIETLPDTGWGLVVKIDQAEALSPVLSHTKRLRGVSMLGALGILLGWAVFLDPVARRLRRMAAGAERVASGDYHTPLDDRRTDELGSMAKSIDKLATDLATDIAVRSDIEQRLRHQATHDATTGLFNRQHATTLLSELAGSTAEEDSSTFSILFIDLDNFKSINDTFGHAAGDEVLAATARRLERVVEGRGCAARWGGDEFVLVLPTTSDGGADDISREIEERFLDPITTQAGSHFVRPSIGVGTHRVGEPIGRLIQNADEAMFENKQRHTGRRSVSAANVRIVEQALEHGEVDVWLQPRVKASQGTSVDLVGAEAFVRVRDRSGDLLAPGTFLKDIERSVVGRELDRHVIRQALAQLAVWIRDERLPADFRLSVNCCEALLRDDDTPSVISAAIAESGLRPENLMIEINEQVAAFQADVIEQLQQMGITIAVDDFGFNNSNVDRLTSGGISVAKIDQRWARTDQRDTDTTSTVIRHLVSLCESLEFEVVAEGVETAEEYARMRNLGVTLFQGYLFSPALSADDFADRLLGPGSSADESALHNDR